MVRRSPTFALLALGAAACTQILGNDFVIVDTTAAGGSGGGGGGDGRALGDPCEDDSGCDSGFCADGVCCDEVCDGACQACDLPGDVGLCSGTTGEVCGTAGCSDGIFVDEAICDAGVCPDTSRACLLGVCDGPDACMTVVDLSLGNGHTCAVWSDGSLRCWGSGSQGQLGQGDADMLFRNVPTVVPGLENVIGVGAGGFHTCARFEDGTVSCWGYSNAGQNGRLMSSGVPALVAGLADVSDLGLGQEHSCAVLTTGEAMCWGLNAESELGRGIDSPIFTEVPDFVCPVGSVGPCVGNQATDIAEIHGGSYHTCLLTTGGVAACWGLANNGRTSHATDTDNPTEVYLGGDSATSVSVGTAHSCVAAAGGSARCWGGNTAGQLGDPNAGTESQFALHVYTDAAGTTLLNGALAVASFSSSTCALRIGGDIRCWGENDSGQLGDGTMSNDSFFAVANGITADATLVRVGGGHACALVGTEDLRCWGGNSGGQLGNGDPTLANQPTPVPVTW